MAVQKTIDKLRERPKDERVAVAGGIAITVIGILLVGWLLLFLRHAGGSGEKVRSSIPSSFETPSIPPFPALGQ